MKGHLSMLLEIRRTCLFAQCPVSVCGGKMFRYLMSGTYQSDEYGTTSGFKIWDRCEDCKEVFGETDVALDTSELREQLLLLFTQWEGRELTDNDFANAIKDIFKHVGGWISNPRQNTG